MASYIEAEIKRHQEAINKADCEGPKFCRLIGELEEQKVGDVEKDKAILEVIGQFRAKQQEVLLVMKLRSKQIEHLRTQLYELKLREAIGKVIALTDPANKTTQERDNARQIYEQVKRDFPLLCRWPAINEVETCKAPTPNNLRELMELAAKCYCFRALKTEITEGPTPQELKQLLECLPSV